MRRVKDGGVDVRKGIEQKKKRKAILLLFTLSLTSCYQSYRNNAVCRIDTKSIAEDGKSNVHYREAIDFALI